MSMYVYKVTATRCVLSRVSRHTYFPSSVMPSLPGYDEGKRKEDEKGEGSRYLTCSLDQWYFAALCRMVCSRRHSKVVNTGTTIVQQPPPPSSNVVSVTEPAD